MSVRAHMEYPSLLSEDEAAARLMMSRRTLRDARKAGLIRYVQITVRKIAYRPEDCDEYISTRLRVEQPKPQRSAESGRGKGRAGRIGNVVVPFSQRKARR